MICKCHGFVNSCKSCEELPPPSISLNLSSFSLFKFRLLQIKSFVSWSPIAIQFSSSIDQFLDNYRLHDHHHECEVEPSFFWTPPLLLPISLIWKRNHHHYGYSGNDVGCMTTITTTIMSANGEAVLFWPPPLLFSSLFHHYHFMIS